MTSASDIKLQRFVKFCIGLEKSFAETLKVIQASHMLPSYDKTFVYKLRKRSAKAEDQKCVATHEEYFAKVCLSLNLDNIV